VMADSAITTINAAANAPSNPDSKPDCGFTGNQMDGVMDASWILRPPMPFGPWDKSRKPVPNPTLSGLGSRAGSSNGRDRKCLPDSAVPAGCGTQRQIRPDHGVIVGSTAAG
jgi:hypothetical protein